ncbi:hypothetical protein C942_04449 [Photobacterium marinum]|uniref:Uncharacterized protein n=1 Tax=Photobacterium marinum TaxID=1056511 RepID=L8JD54_9GAMM|nr:hypothetical protein C942_04449 [Photobacterium marinum]
MIFRLFIVGDSDAFARVKFIEYKASIVFFTIFNAVDNQCLSLFR